MSDNKDQIESEEYPSEEENDENQEHKKKVRILGKRANNKPKPRRMKYQSSIIFLFN
jgi:hypothetical protein